MFTEVSKLWDNYMIPHFNIFHQHGTNKGGGACIVVEKHVKASRIDFSAENTVIADVYGLSKPTRIIDIY